MTAKNFLNGVLVFKGVVSVLVIVILMFGAATASASISMYGVGNGAISYQSTTDIFQHNGVSGNTIRVSDLFGRGAMEVAYSNEVSDEGISGYIGADLYNGTLLMRDGGIVTGSGNINQTESVPCVFGEEEEEFCEYCTFMQSDNIVTLEGQGTAISQIRLTQVYPTGGIDHTTTMEGNGSFNGMSAYEGYLGRNATEISISTMADRFSFSGTNISVSRHVVFVAEHTL